MFVDYTGLTLGGLVVMILTTGLLLLVGYDILPITFDRMPLDIRNDVDYLRYAAWNNRFEDENNIIRRRVSSNGTEVSEVLGNEQAHTHTHTHTCI